MGVFPRIASTLVSGVSKTVRDFFTYLQEENGKLRGGEYMYLAPLLPKVIHGGLDLPDIVKMDTGKVRIDFKVIRYLAIPYVAKKLTGGPSGNFAVGVIILRRYV